MLTLEEAGSLGVSSDSWTEWLQWITERRPLSLADAAYLAGLFDGEGTLSLTAHRYSERDGTRRSHGFGVRASVANTDLGVIEFVQSVVGGGNIRREEKGDGQKTCYVLRIGAVDCRRLIPQIYPYLRIKKRQGQLLLRFMSLQDDGKRSGRRGLDLADVPEALQIHREILERNQRGTGNTEQVELDFTVREAKEPKRTCDEEGCEDRRYRSHLYCYKHWLQRREPHPGVCKQCGKDFDAIMPHKQFCSDACQSAHWWRSVGKPKAEAEKRHKRLCPGCSQYFVADNKLKQYCSRSCYLKLRRAQQTAAELGLPKPERLSQVVGRGDVVQNKPCAFCHEPFETKNKKRIYCSQKCRSQAGIAQSEAKRHAEAAKREVKPCPVCGTLVDRSHYKRKVYCSQKCYDKAKNAGKPSKANPAVTKQCLTCGAEFETTRSTQTRCSDKCRRKAYEQRLRAE
jgi:hypothetical protein